MTRCWPPVGGGEGKQAYKAYDLNTHIIAGGKDEYANRACTKRYLLKRRTGRSAAGI